MAGHAVSSVDFGFIDYSVERSHTGIFTVNLTAANIVAQTTLINNLATAIQAIVDGTLSTQRIILSNTIIDGTIPTLVSAQRENKWLVRYHDDTTGEKYTVTIPTASLGLLASHSDMADETASQYTAFKTAFEAVAASPNQTNGVVLDSLQFVGRNL